MEASDDEFLKAYTNNLGALVLFALINDLESGGGWIGVASPVVNDRQWVEHHIFAKAKVGSYGPKAKDLKEAAKPFEEIRESPAKFKTQINELRAALKTLFPDEVSRLEKIWRGSES